jgi:hypothetical protein
MPCYKIIWYNLNSQGKLEQGSCFHALSYASDTIALARASDHAKYFGYLAFIIIPLPSMNGANLHDDTYRK